MYQFETNPLHYEQAYALLIDRIERLITQLTDQNIAYPQEFICTALIRALNEAEDTACAP